MNPARYLQRKTRLAFTLVELLVVIAIAAILVGISVPTFLQVTQASALTSASNQIVDQLSLARQQVLSINEQVEVRFYSVPSVNNSSVNVYRALQPFGINLTSIPASTNALARPTILSSQVQIASSTTLSTLLDTTRTDVYTGTGATANFALPNFGQNYTYTAFRFKSDGSTTLTAPLCVTVHLINNPPNGNTPPKNWATAQVDPVTGRIQTFRP